MVHERLANGPRHATVTMALAAHWPLVDAMVKNEFATAGARAISLTDIAFYSARCAPPAIQTGRRSY